MPLIRAGDVELDCERRGEGPPLLLIMGMSGTRHHWGKPFLELLVPDFEVITYDHRGVGDSSRVEGHFTIADLAADAAALLSALEIDSAHVMGISMGGMVAQELAIANPELVRTLVLGCTYCGGPESALAGTETTRILRDALITRDREQMVRAFWQVNVSPSFAANEAAAATFMEIGMSKGVASVVVMEQMRALAAHDTTARLGEIAAPTLIVHGSADLMLPVQNAYVIAQLMPRARLEVMDGVGHLFFWERPQQAATLVSEHAVVRA